MAERSLFPYKPFGFSRINRFPIFAFTSDAVRSPFFELTGVVKMKFLSKLTTCTVALAGCLSLASNAMAQEKEQDDIQIEIVDQDGEKVKASVIELSPQGQAKGHVIVGGRIAGGGGVSIANKDGKITIVDGDGNKREIDVSGARSITVNQSVRAIIKDGEEKRQSFGKAIIIGPDGTRQEIELAPGQQGAFVFDDLNPGAGWNQMQVAPVKGSYMIGVNCSPVSELVSKQLQLESNTGLVVESVSKDSPSQAAGIEVHDILMFADDRRLATIKDLTDVIKTAGKEKAKFSITLLRAGKEMNVEITPIERPAGAFGATGMMPGDMLPPNVDFKFRRLAPGVIMGSGFQDTHKQMELEMKAMREQMQKMQQDMQEQFEKDKS